MSLPTKLDNWKLGEKKTIKAQASLYESTVKQIDAKLGGGWTVEVDFGAFGQHSQNASSSYRKDPGKYIIMSLLSKFYSSDLGQMDQMSIDTVNNLVQSAKKLTYTCGPKSSSYAISNRINISCDSSNGVTLTWNGDYFGYDHGDDYFAKWIDSQPGAVANAPFPGSWTASQLKSIVAKQSGIDSFKNSIKSKLGSDWQVQVDWENFATHSKNASSSYQNDPGKYIVDNILQRIFSSDICQMQQDTVDTLNKNSGHLLKVTLGPKSASYAVSNRVNVNFDGNQTLVQWNGDYFGYEYNESYLLNFVDDQRGIAADPPYPGQWRLKDLKSLKGKQSSYDNALNQAKAKLGSEWSFNVDWASFAQNCQNASSSYLNDVGRYIMDELFGKWASCDLCQWDEDVCEALNELVGDKKVINWRLGPKSSSYAISNRCNISVDESNGATFEWNGDYFGYQWQEAYAQKFILDNA